MTAQKGRQKRNAFLFLLKTRYPKDFSEILARVKKYANVKEKWARYGEPLTNKLHERKKIVVG